VKYTQRGTITVSCRAFNEPEGLRNSKQIAVEIIVGDTGCGIPVNKLESIFREFEQVESAQPKTSTTPGLGLGLAVVARSVEQLGGQLRVDSEVDQGSRFSFLIPFTIWDGSGRNLVGQGGYRRTGAPASHPSPSSSLGTDMSIEHEREVPDDRSVSPLPGQSVIDNVNLTPESQMVPPPEVVGAEVKAVDVKLRPRPSLRRRGTVHLEDRSPGQGSETKLRILSVEVRYTSNTEVLRRMLDKLCTFRTTTSIV
jgi:Histidine kinase-, DNA gyrase B-, and HSP90-like ATPase